MERLVSDKRDKLKSIVSGKFFPKIGNPQADKTQKTADG